jgi:hypothetical protein
MTEPTTTPDKVARALKTAAGKGAVVAKESAVVGGRTLGFIGEAGALYFLPRVAGATLDQTLIMFTGNEGKDIEFSDHWVDKTGNVALRHSFMASNTVANAALNLPLLHAGWNGVGKTWQFAARRAPGALGSSMTGVAESTSSLTTDLGGTWLGTTVRVAGGAAVGGVASAAVGVTETAYGVLSEDQEIAGNGLATTGGAAGGCAVGAGIGALSGAPVGGVGAIPGAIGGCAIGAMSGGMGGGYAHNLGGRIPENSPNRMLRGARFVTHDMWNNGGQYLILAKKGDREKQRTLTIAAVGTVVPMPLAPIVTDTAILTARSIRYWLAEHALQDDLREALPTLNLARNGWDKYLDLNHDHKISMDEAVSALKKAGLDDPDKLAAAAHIKDYQPGETHHFTPNEIAAALNNSVVTRSGTPAKR